MIRLLSITFYFFLISLPIGAQENTETNYHSPLGIPLVLSANFGELRPNHFHMGLDFKTNLKTGYKIYSIADGYVSRVKVSPYGYGKVVYIDHPDGRTSVYAHCSEFKGKVDSLVKATQKEEESFAIEVYPAKGQIPIKRGEVFALSGNTGGSTAPHLHFEIRDTKTEHALNPLICGFDIADSKAPELRGIKIYGVTKDGYRYPEKVVTKSVLRGSSGYYVSGDQIVVPSDYCSKTGGIGISVDAIDRFDGASNQCGLYGSVLIVNGDTIFGQQSDRVPFESTRYVNVHKDFDAYAILKKKYHKAFRTTENDLPIYKYDKEQGVIKAKPGDVMAVKYVAYDVKGNRSEFTFELVVQQGPINTVDEIPTSKAHLHPQETYLYSTNDLEIECGHATVYEPESVDEMNIRSKFIDARTPVNRTYKIKVKAPENYDGKSYLEFITAKGSKRAVSLTEFDGWLIAECKYFGNYSVKRDTEGPKVFPLNFTSSTNYLSKNTLTWKITERGSGIKEADLFIDGKWYLLEYEYKGDLLTFERPKELYGPHTIVIRSEDNCGNITEWTKDLIFKE